MSASSNPALRAFGDRFRGHLIWPGDPEYELARRAESASNDRRPALIARAADDADVVSTIRFASESMTTLAIRSGGHSIAGDSTGDGVLVLDLAGLAGLEIDASTSTAWAGPGVTTGRYTAAAEALGLATPFGDHGTVGIGGITVGGGIGWLVRKYGLTIDSLLAADLVTADGEQITASATEHPDLFWAIRGGGGNFGVVTRFQFVLHPIATVLHGTILVPWTHEAFERLLALALAAPDELTLMPGVAVIPPMDEVATEHHGQLGLFVDTLWCGAVDAGWEVIAALRSLGPVLLDTVGQKAYSAVFPEPSGNRSAWTSRATFVDRIEPGTLAEIDRSVASAPPGETFLQFRILGGAAGRPSAVATAYGWREKQLLAWIIADTGSDDPSRMRELAAWAAGFQARLAAWGTGTYVNFMADEGPEAVVSAYPTPTFNRLREIKRRYDPDNVFRHNRNIPPGDGGINRP